MGWAATMTKDELIAAFAAAAAAHPAIARWQPVGNASDNTTCHVLEITAGAGAPVAAAAVPTSLAPVASGKVGVLFVGGIHGDEAQVPEGLLAAVRWFLGVAAQAVAPGANPATVVDVVANRACTITLGDIAAMLNRLHILIYPLANPWGYNQREPHFGASTRENKNTVDLNRNFPVLFNGFRDGVGLQYFKNGPPAGWNVARPGAAAANQPETRNIITLMNLPAVSVFADLHSGYGHLIMYPWSFHPNGGTPTHRYCNPGFAALAAQPNDGTANYREYVPASSLANLTAFAADVLKAVQAVNTAKAPAAGAAAAPPPPPHTYVVTQNIVMNGRPDLAGGISIDTMFAQDVCHVRALLIEAGTGSTDTQHVGHDLRAIVVSACHHVARQLPGALAAFRKAPAANPLALPCK